MPYEHKNNRGSFFPPNDNAHPDALLAGDINIEGELYWITMWKKNKKDQKYWSISVVPKGKKAEPEQKKTTVERAAELNFDDEVPF